MNASVVVAVVEDLVSGVTKPTTDAAVRRKGEDDVVIVMVQNQDSKGS